MHFSIPGLARSLTRCVTRALIISNLRQPSLFDVRWSKICLSIVRLVGGPSDGGGDDGRGKKDRVIIFGPLTYRPYVLAPALRSLVVVDGAYGHMVGPAAQCQVPS